MSEQQEPSREPWATLTPSASDPRYVILTTRTGFTYRIPSEPLRFPDDDDAE